MGEFATKRLIKIFCWSLCSLALCHLLLFSSSCSSKGYSKSDIFQHIFEVDNGTFRGTTLGEHIERVKQNENPNNLTHEDVLGLRYEVPVGEGGKMIVAYYKDDLQTNKESNRVSSIVANILLPSEMASAPLYMEIQDYFAKNHAYGLSSGSYGNFIWESRIKNGIEVHLKLDDNKKGITLNFIDVQQENSSFSPL